MVGRNGGLARLEERQVNPDVSNFFGTYTPR
ncbi:MAG: hypothetical protein JWR83_863, partial [Aeromicrobium sp.]|nr:hypothetical protein [Aeromicrobium sp.]